LYCHGGGDAGGYISLLCGDNSQFWQVAVKHTQNQLCATKYLFFALFTTYTFVHCEEKIIAVMHDCMNLYSSVVLFQIPSCYILKYPCVGRLVWDCKSVTE
jgi:hypothetical protein